MKMKIVVGAIRAILCDIDLVELDFFCGLVMAQINSVLTVMCPEITAFMLLYMQNYVC